MSETQAESTAPVETTEVDSEVGKAPGEGSAPSGTEAAASGDDTSKWTQKAQQRYDELTEARYREASRADRETYRREQVERELAELRATAAKPETVAPSDDYPTLESVGWDEDRHKAAVAVWSAAQAREAARAELQSEREAGERAQSAKDWTRKQQEFSTKNPDYVQKVVESGRRGDWACTPAMAQVIQESDVGPEITQYLAENAAKSFEIASLPPHLQHREIGRIEARLEIVKTAPPPVSKAPPPPVKIEAADSTGETDPSKMTDTQFAKWRRKQIAQRR